VNEATTVAKLYHFDTDHDRLFRKASPTPSRAQTMNQSQAEVHERHRAEAAEQARDAGISWKKWRPTSASGNETPCARTTARTAWDSDERECDPKKLP